MKKIRRKNLGNSLRMFIMELHFPRATCKVWHSLVKTEKFKLSGYDRSLILVSHFPLVPGHLSVWWGLYVCIRSLVGGFCKQLSSIYHMLSSPSGSLNPCLSSHVHLPNILMSLLSKSVTENTTVNYLCLLLKKVLLLLVY